MQQYPCRHVSTPCFDNSFYIQKILGAGQATKHSFPCFFSTVSLSDCSCHSLRIKHVQVFGESKCVPQECNRSNDLIVKVITPILLQLSDCNGCTQIIETNLEDTLPVHLTCKKEKLCSCRFHADVCVKPRNECVTCCANQCKAMLSVQYNVYCLTGHVLTKKTEPNCNQEINWYPCFPSGHR